MHVRELDLNLLHVFSAVHRLRNVSRAAESLGLSQPAVSHALTRLRLALHDPLFVRAPGGVAATPRAERFARQVEDALRVLDAALHEADAFDPRASTRRFRVHMSDIGADEFLPPLMRAVEREAPGVRLEVVQLAPEAIGGALDEGRLDLAFGFLPGLATERAPLLQERYVVLLRRGHPLAARLADRQALQQLEFVLVASHSEPARALHLLGLESRIRVTVPQFLVAPALLAATDLAVVMPLRPARRFAALHALRVVEPDLGLPPFTVSLHWSWRVQQDAGHRWLRQLALELKLRAMPRATSPAATRPGPRAGRPAPGASAPTRRRASPRE